MIATDNNHSVVQTHGTSIQPNTEKHPTLKFKTRKNDTIKQAAGDIFIRHKDDVYAKK
jgi:hypothetical protein